MEQRREEPRRLTASERVLGCAILLLAAPLAWHAVRWSLLDAVWAGPAAACTGVNGACWAVITEKARLLLVGLYPTDQAWRAAGAAGLVIVAACGLRAGLRSGAAGIGLLVTGGLAAPLWLLGGGWGLTPVASALWGGLTLTVVLSGAVIATASGLALPLALARSSSSPFLRHPARGVIELLRGVPLVALLLAADLLLPALLPREIEIPKLLRAFLAVALLATVNLAEVLRGALRSVPPGQREGALALGLSAPVGFALVVLPQALRIAVPAAVNVFVGAIKDTSLVLIVGVLDVTGAAKAAVADPAWMRYAPEIYLALAAAYFAVCFPIARTARRLERQAQAASPSSRRSISARSL